MAKRFVSDDACERLNNFSGTLREADAARFIVDNDYRTGASARQWARNLNRWLAGDRVPTPSMVRFTLEALEYNWLVGLGESGYKQHAICLIHALWAVGRRKQATTAARMIFASTLEESLEYKPGLTRAKTGAPPLDRLENVARAIWPGDDGEIPTRARAPRDLGASPLLFSAWLALENARASKRPSIATEILFSEATKMVRLWIAEEAS